MHVCILCKKNFDSAYKYERHMKNKNSCDPLVREHIRTRKITCKYCQHVSYDKTNNSRHEKTCKNKTKNDNNTNELKEIIAKLTDTVNKQSDQIGQLIKKESGIINIGNIGNIDNSINKINQTQNLYNITPFGKENLDFITDKQYNKIFEKGCRALQSFVELVHCNQNRPENMNIYIGNFKDEYIRTYNGKDWDMEFKDDVLHNLFHTKRDFLESKYNSMKSKKGVLSDDAKYFFGQMYFQNCKTAEGVKFVKDDIKTLLYNNRMYVIKNPNKINKRKKLIKNEKNSDDSNNNYNDPTDHNYIPEFPMF